MKFNQLISKKKTFEGHTDATNNISTTYFKILTYRALAESCSEPYTELGET
jgi:hypothetical protein